MKTNKINNNTNFGWRYYTHKKITGKLVDEFPKLKESKDLIVKMVARPDFDERGFQGNNHFYYPPQLFRPRESFFDFFGRNNALASYTGHLFKFKKNLELDEKKALSEAGRALHFLQDITQPNHVERGNILEKWRDLSMHKRFENYVYANEDQFIANAQPPELEVPKGDFLDLFEEAVFLSECTPKPKTTNNNVWHAIAQDGISNAIAVTRAFLQNVSDLMS